MRQKIIYYNDPLKDEFSGVGPRRSVKIDASFPFIRRNPVFRFLRLIVYRGIMTPFAWLYTHMRFRPRFEGREKLRPYRKTGCFFYGNHTQIPADAFIPNLFGFPKNHYFIVNPDNIALPGTRNLMMMLGALPVPTARSGFKPFHEAIRQRISEGAAVVIYPEAHIWPYCTWIRPFPATSFHYPAKIQAPVFAFTVTYRKSRRGKPRIIVYLDGPFFSAAPQVKERQQDLHSQVYQAMRKRAENPDNYAFTEYRKNPEASL